jgi:VanZ family protein
MCYSAMMVIILRFIAWLLAAAVTFSTLGPATLRPHSDLGQNGEHALAFILLGVVFGLAYPRSRSRTAAVVVILVGVLELMQLVAPGRHARLEDFIVGALATCAGSLVVVGADWLRKRCEQPA